LFLEVTMAPQRRKSDRLIEFRGVLLRQWRHEAGYVPADLLAEALRRYPECDGTTKFLISNWERLKTRPDLPVMLALVELSGKPFRDWFTWPGKDQT